MKKDRYTWQNRLNDWQNNDCIYKYTSIPRPTYTCKYIHTPQALRKQGGDYGERERKKTRESKKMCV